MANPNFLPLNEQRCSNCRYQRVVSGRGVVIRLCCRNAPTAGALFPVQCPAVDWCGEWANMEVYR